MTLRDFSPETDLHFLKAQQRFSALRHQVRKVDPQPPHALANFGPFLGEKLLTLALAKRIGCAFDDIHANPALNLIQPVILELLLSLRNRQRVGAFLCSEGAHGRKHRAFCIVALDDGRRDLVAQFEIYGSGLGHDCLFKRTSAIIQRCASSEAEPRLYRRLPYATLYGARETKASHAANAR